MPPVNYSSTSSNEVCGTCGRSQTGGGRSQSGEGRVRTGGGGRRVLCACKRLVKKCGRVICIGGGDKNPSGRGRSPNGRGSSPNGRGSSPNGHVRRLRGFRVRSSTSPALYGLAADSLENIKDKAKEKLKLSSSSSSALRVFLLDGTEVDEEEYFAALANQTILIVVEGKSEAVAEDKSLVAVKRLLRALRGHSEEESLVSDIMALMGRSIRWAGDDGHAHTGWDVVRDAVAAKSKDKAGRTHFSSRQEDPDWFKDVVGTARSKEEYLFKGCAARVRGYLSKGHAQLKEELGPDVPSLSSALSEVMRAFRSRLTTHGYYGAYFDRSAETDKRMCDRTGVFLCQGRFDESTCKSLSADAPLTAASHVINPYESAETRILFSTWNLDHVIERSRTVIPCLAKALMESAGRAVNVDYFADLLFTRANLKLVHVVCHDKRHHAGKCCDHNKIYLGQRTKRAR